MIVKIVSHLLGLVQEKIDKLNKKAVKLGCPVISFKVLGDIFQTITDDNTGKKITYKLHEVEVIGEAPKLNNWVFLASIQHTDNGNVLKSLDNSISLEAYRTVGPICEHCNISRYRKDTYVVRNIETNELKQVGSSCLKDFTGHNNPEAVASYYDSMLELLRSFREDSEYREFGGGESLLSLDYFLPIVTALIRLFGWVSNKQARETDQTSTCTEALYYYDYKNKKDFDKVIGELTETDKETALKALEWINSLIPDNDYIHNLKTVCSSNWIEFRHAGIACSLINAYQRELAKNAPKADKLVSDYVGNIGDRLNFKVTVKNVFSVDTMYGVLHINIMYDEKGNCLVWKTGSNELNIGDTIGIKGTIKEHTEYKGTKQTVLSRCKVL